MAQKRTALITGDGGIGHALALELHARGLRVFATARSLASMEKLAVAGIETFSLDVTSEESVATVKAEVEKLTSGSLDMLVNNAAVFYESTAAEDALPKIQTLYNVNVFGTMRVTQAFIPLLLSASKTLIASQRDRTEWAPRIVQMSSLAAICPTPFYSAYNSSKAAMMQYGNTMRVELEPFGVKVVTVHIGRVMTNIIRDKENDWQGLPEGSIYAPIKDVYEGPAHEVFPDGAVSCETFAKDTVPKLLSKNGNAFVWTVGQSPMMWFFDAFFPRTIWDWFLRKTFSMNRLAIAFRKSIAEKKAV
ncbi:hypothetical protein EIP91_009111 [Steccherinum ochraceum]|uniref:Hydroxynaphthalene reductase-like protein Arp2 n=1 Tax=Steccherinum ochraceum TaxID=92696 RepID=A0A4R0RF70_9APHY|nr:hypothetical protein EIP91_009111 [Steccherinum ochraceum]